MSPDSRSALITDFNLMYAAATRTPVRAVWDRRPFTGVIEALESPRRVGMIIPGTPIRRHIALTRNPMLSLTPAEDEARLLAGAQVIMAEAVPWKGPGGAGMATRLHLAIRCQSGEPVWPKKIDGMPIRSGLLRLHLGARGQRVPARLVRLGVAEATVRFSPQHRVPRVDYLLPCVLTKGRDQVVRGLARVVDTGRSRSCPGATVARVRWERLEWQDALRVQELIAGWQYSEDITQRVLMAAK